MARVPGGSEIGCADCVGRGLSFGSSHSNPEVLTSTDSMIDFEVVSLCTRRLNSQELGGSTA